MSLKICEENGHHDWIVEYYDDYNMICFSATCKICSATAESREIEVVE
jgi:hypothetical protein